MQLVDLEENIAEVDLVFTGEDVSMPRLHMARHFGGWQAWLKSMEPCDRFNGQHRYWH